MLRHNSDDMVLALAGAPVDPRTGNRVLYSANWIATNDSMIGEINPDWVRRELAWFNSGSNNLADMEDPVPALFQACADPHGVVNSAYGHILFGASDELPPSPTLYQRIVKTFVAEGQESRHGVAIISDRDIHNLARRNGRNDFICTNALNVMIDHDGKLHIVAQMRSMDAVFGYRADYSMWNDLMLRLLIDLNNYADTHPEFEHVKRGDITFQVANLHVYPRHFALLERWADIVSDKLDRQAFGFWRGAAQAETD